MKNVYFIFIILFTLFAQGQNKPAIKIYLEDAETGKNIADAKVTLEGFEIPAITGKYNQKEKYYYFDQIPTGYNTIMAYHKKYNEKGFQDTSGLPKDLKLKFYTPYRVKIPSDSLNYYKEDPSKLVIMMTDTIYNSNIKCEGYNTVSYLCFAKKYFKDHYPDLVVGSETSNFFSLTDFSFYVMKKNCKAFKRFNDPIIKKLEDDKNILFHLGMLLETKINKPEYKQKKEYFKQDGKPNYIPKHIKYVNYDTLNHLQPNQRPNLDIYSTIDRNGKITKPKKIKAPKKNYSDIYLSYKDKYKRGLLKNEIYTLNEKELDSLYKIDAKKIKKGLLYDFEAYQSTDTLVDYRKYYTNDIDLKSSKPYPYVVVSNILKISGLDQGFKAKKFGQIIFIEKSLENSYKSDKNIIEQIQKNDFQKLYKLKANFGSPCGIMDLLEYHNDKLVIKLYQNLNKVNIYDFTR
jgi:hypothetical protein